MRGAKRVVDRERTAGCAVGGANRSAGIEIGGYMYRGARNCRTGHTADLQRLQGSRGVDDSGNRGISQQKFPAWRGDLPELVGGKIARAGVIRQAAGALRDKESVSRQSHVGGNVGRIQSPLGEIGIRGGNRNARACLHWVPGAVRGAGP